MFGGNFAPAGWAFCDGRLIPISVNDTLFNLIGTTYGGDGQTTFALPDFRGRVPIHQGSGLVIGEQGGAETVTLTTNQIPAHSHVALCSTALGNQSPSNGVWATSNQNIYSDQATAITMSASAIQGTGGSQPHQNMMPYLIVSFILSLFGIFPTQN